MSFEKVVNNNNNNNNKRNHGPGNGEGFVLF